TPQREPDARRPADRVGENGGGDAVGEAGRRHGSRQQAKPVEEAASRDAVNGAVRALGQMAFQVVRNAPPVEMLLQQMLANTAVHAPILTNRQPCASVLSPQPR